MCCRQEGGRYRHDYGALGLGCWYAVEGGSRFRGGSKARDAYGATMGVVLAMLGGQSLPGLGGISNGRGPPVFQTCWCYSRPLLVSHRPTAGPGASSTLC